MPARSTASVTPKSSCINAVTPAVVQEAFRKDFPLDRYTVITLLPEPALAQQ